MRVLGLLCVVLRGICWANAASHSLKYIYTVVTGNIDSPEFIITGFVNDEQFVHYDSKIRRMIPKTEWMEKSVDEQYWDKQTQKALYAHQIFKDNIVIAMQHFRSTQDVPILEWIVACWWNDETGDTGGIDRYGYDGKYFLTDEMKTWHFIPPAQFISAVKWNPAELENDKQYQTQICIESLKKYVSYRSTLERTDKDQNPRTVKIEPYIANPEMSIKLGTKTDLLVSVDLPLEVNDGEEKKHQDTISDILSMAKLGSQITEEQLHLLLEINDFLDETFGKTAPA